MLSWPAHLTDWPRIPWAAPLWAFFQCYLPPYVHISPLSLDCKYICVLDLFDRWEQVGGVPCSSTLLQYVVYFSEHPTTLCGIFSVGKFSADLFMGLRWQAVFLNIQPSIGLHGNCKGKNDALDFSLKQSSSLNLLLFLTLTHTGDKLRVRNRKMGWGV